MSTGLTSWSNPAEIGGLYPFGGWEVLFVLVATILWLLWHARQTRDENVEYDEALEMYERIGLERALHHGGGARVADPHDLLEATSLNRRTAAEPAVTVAEDAPPPPPADPPVAAPPQDREPRG